MRTEAQMAKTSLIRHQADASDMDHLHGNEKGAFRPLFLLAGFALAQQRRTRTGGPAAKELGGGGEWGV